MLNGVVIVHHLVAVMSAVVWRMIAWQLVIVSVCFTGLLSLCKCTCQYKENQQAMEVQHRSYGTFVGDLFEGFWVFVGLRNCDVNEDTVSGTIVLCDSLCLYNVDRCYWLVFYSLSLYQVAVLEWLQSSVSGCDIVWFSGHLPVLRHDSGSTTDVMQIMEYLRKLVSFLWECMSMCECHVFYRCRPTALHWQH